MHNAANKGSITCTSAVAIHVTTIHVNDSFRHHEFSKSIASYEL